MASLGVSSIMVILTRLGQLQLSVRNPGIVALGCGTNFGGLGALVSVVLFKTITLDVIPM